MKRKKKCRKVETCHICLETIDHDAQEGGACGCTRDAVVENRC